MADETITTALIAAGTGVAGIAIGAWLNAMLTTRRERWNLRRELYTRLLENLGEAKEALPRLMPLIDNVSLQGTDDDDTDRLRKDWQQKVDVLNEQIFGALNKVQRAARVAVILLGEEAMQALEQLQKERTNAQRQTDALQYLDRELFAVKAAYDLIVKAAREDLRVKRNWKSWLKAWIRRFWTWVRSAWERGKP